MNGRLNDTFPVMQRPAHTCLLAFRVAGQDKTAFSQKMSTDDGAWRALMDQIAGSERDSKTSLPDPILWRQDVGKLAAMTGLRREEFANDKDYAEAVALIVPPPRLPDSSTGMPPLPDHFAEPPLVGDVKSALLDVEPLAGTRGVVVIGIGGAGKSMVASAVARDKSVRHHFSDGVLWVTDDSKRCLLDQLNALAKQFRKLILKRYFRQGKASQYEDKDFKDLNQARGYFPMWQKKHRLKCLLVVDNAWSSVRERLRTF